MASDTAEVKMPKKPVELYLVRLSPPSRAVWLYLLQHKIPHKLIDIDLTRGEETTPSFMKMNPHQEVPVLVDDTVIIFEGQAILRYLSMTYTNRAGYGFTLPVQMMCESLISWANSELHRAIGFRYAYPQVFQRYRLPSDTATESLIESGIQELTKYLEILDQLYLTQNTFLCGDSLTVADFYVATMLLQAEWADLEIRMWPKIHEWLQTIKREPHWEEVHQAHAQFVTDCSNDN